LTWEKEEAAGVARHERDTCKHQTSIATRDCGGLGTINYTPPSTTSRARSARDAVNQAGPALNGPQKAAAGSFLASGFRAQQLTFHPQEMVQVGP
jgi:hypothetical protein